jgi:hypothetical protein
MAFASTVTGADALDGIDQGMTELETQGVTPDGIAAGPAIGSALRQAYREIQAPPSQVPQRVLYGVPVETTLDWPVDAANAIIGGWQYLAIGIREDVTFGRSNDGVLVDDDGSILATAFQDNVTLIKIYMRLGVAIGQPLKANSNDRIEPFVAVDWTAGAGGAGNGGNGGSGASATTRKRATSSGSSAAPPA